MTPEEIIENNKLIAEFMHPDAKRDFDSIPEDGDVDESYFQIAKMMLIVGDYNLLKYNYSWNWLMEVVEKIESLTGSYHVQIGKTGNGGASNKMCAVVSKYIDYTHYDVFNKYFYPPEWGWSIGETKIESTWIAIVEFIKWYNIQKNGKK